MSERDKEQCSQERMSGYHLVQCRKTATVERDGRHYCAIHDPERRRERDEANHAKWRAKLDKVRDEQARIAACLAACEGLSDPQAALHAMREALKGFIEDSLDEHGDDHHEDDCPRCELIIKARAALELWEAK